MASPAVALPNGLAEPAHHDYSSVDVDMTDAASHQSSPAKRKREPSLNGAASDGSAQQHRPAAEQPSQARASANGASSHPRHPSIRDYLLVLERFDATPSLLKRPLPDPDAADEPSAKRKRAEDGSPLPSIADKAARNEYAHLEAVVADIKVSVKDQLAELRSIDADKATKADDAAIARTIAFEQKARELFRRESTYPSLTQNAAVLRTLDSSNDLQSNASGNMVLSVYGEAPRHRQLYSSLQHRVPTPDSPDGAVQPLRQSDLPHGIKTVKAVPFSFPSAVEKDKKSKTLGELFPAPRNLPSLQPPKAPKSTTKGVQVGWHRPELTEKSKYRTGTYFGQPLSTGRWLDYSQAAPPSQIIPKERERAMSLAGTKPSSDDLDKTEMESLFRGAFSSFAPSKDDSAAMVSSGMISQTMWWQKYGKRSFDRLVEVEAADETTEESTKTEEEEDVDLDDALLQEAIESWDTRVDPSLEEMCNPKKSREEQDADDILQDVSDMIQTLVSFQKNRNLTLPSAANQSRYSADPAHSDMLTSGTPVQPSEEETLTYETLKAQLVLVIQMLPPYAVARLNSDKLEELNISTKLEVRADEYQGVMEEDEAAARARAAAAQQASATARPPSHRSSGSSSGLQYGTQYGATNRTPMATPGYYGAQTPARPPSVSRATPGIPPSYTPQQRPPSNAGYRPPPNGYPGGTNFVPQMTRAQPPYGQQPPNAYAATPPQNRPPYQQPPPYHNMPNNANTPPRYGGQPPQSAQTPHYPQHGYPQHQQPPGTPSHPPPYNPYANGGPGIPQRTVSPQVAHQQQPQYMQQPPPQGFNPNATPTRPPQYGAQPTPVGGHPQPRFYPPTGSPQVGPPHAPQVNPGQGQHNQQQGTSFQTSLQPHQVQQAMDQAKARFNAHTKAQDGIRPMPAQGQQVAAPVGLGGIGLGGARPNMPGAVNYNTPSPSPKPQTNSPAMPAMQAMPQAPMNGTAGPSPAGPNGNGTLADPHTNA